MPIASGMAGLVLALVCGLGWTMLSSAIDGLSYGLVAAGPVGLFAYGVLHRLPIVTGLHHILNNIFWFVIGDSKGRPTSSTVNAAKSACNRMTTKHLGGLSRE